MENFNAEYFRKKYTIKKDLNAHFETISKRLDDDLSKGKTPTCYYCDSSVFDELSEALIEKGFSVKDVSDTKNIRKEGYKVIEISL